MGWFDWLFGSNKKKKKVVRSAAVVRAAGKRPVPPPGRIVRESHVPARPALPPRTVPRTLKDTFDDDVSVTPAVAAALPEVTYIDDTPTVPMSLDPIRPSPAPGPPPSYDPPLHSCPAPSYDPPSYSPAPSPSYDPPAPSPSSWD